MKRHETDLLHGPLWNKIPLFALPVAATAILEQLFNASDVAVVGNFTGSNSTVAVAAVGAAITKRWGVRCTPPFSWPLQAVFWLHFWEKLPPRRFWGC